MIHKTRVPFLLMCLDRNGDCEVIQLICTPHAVPIFKLRAILPALHNTIESYHCHLHGDYVCLQGRCLIYLWDWRNGTRGSVCEYEGAGEV